MNRGFDISMRLDPKRVNLLCPISRLECEFNTNPRSEQFSAEIHTIGDDDYGNKNKNNKSADTQKKEIDVLRLRCLCIFFILFLEKK